VKPMCYTPSIKPLSFSLGQCHAVIQYHIVLLDDFDIICNDLGKALVTFAPLPQKNIQFEGS